MEKLNKYIKECKKKKNCQSVKYATILNHLEEIKEEFLQEMQEKDEQLLVFASNNTDLKMGCEKLAEDYIMFKYFGVEVRG